MSLYSYLASYKLVYVVMVILSHNVHISNCLFGSKLLVVLYDGFRWDYTSLTDTPNLDKVASLGSKAHHVNPVFLSKTGPAMYSIATGQYPETHGIISNNIYDPSILPNSTFHIFNTTSDVRTKLYEGTEPIWVTAGKAGLKTACHDWPGCDTEISGYKADYLEPHSNTTTPQGQVDLAMKWFTENDVSLVLLHYIDPDKTGHMTGPAPESQDTLAMIRTLDDVTGYMLKQLDEHDILEEVNVLLVSDHGMTSVSFEDRSVALYDFIDPPDVDVIVEGSVWMGILPSEGQLEKVYTGIKDKHPNISVFYKEEIPERFHYGKHYRVLPILIVADEGWSIFANATDHQRSVKGNHGYDNSLMSMKPFFYAMGPDIQAQVEIPEFNQVDLCPLMCKLLQLTPNHLGNGTFDPFEHMVRTDPMDMRGWLILMTSLGVVTLVFLLTVVMVACRRHIAYTNPNTKINEEDERKYLYHKLEDT